MVLMRFMTCFSSFIGLRINKFDVYKDGLNVTILAQCKLQPNLGINYR